MNDKKQVLILTDRLDIGGYDIVAYNFQKSLNKDKFECTYLLRNEKIGLVEKDAVNNGAKIIRQPKDKLSYFKSYFYLKKFLKNNHFDVVHSHLMFYSGIVMRAAYKAGVKKRIAHSHFTDPCIQNRSKLKKIIAEIYQSVMRIWLRKYATDLIACGPEAGEYLYGEKTFLEKGVQLNNGIYTEIFEYNTQCRNKICEEFGLGQSIVLGHVGRLNYIKNHKYLLNVFYEFQKKHNDSFLLIVGDGEERQNIENQAENLGISSKVIITGIRTDVNALLSAMDCFVFPSLKEGFPLTLVEAQASKLPCLISDSVTKSAKLNDNVVYLSLDKNPKIWSDKINELINIDRNSVDIQNLKKDFDIKECAQKLENIYLS